MRLFKNRKGHSSGTHILIGFIVLCILYCFNNKYHWLDSTTLTILDYAFIIFITWIYSQMPDIDQPGAKINLYGTIAGICLIVYSFIEGEKTLGIATAIILGLFRLIEHRTIIHSLIASIIFSAPLYFIKPIYAIIAFIMFLVHIISEGEFSLLFEKDWRLLR
jgi:membrane-bound metal-dependent hydrolase YbcI (DUF457 family)